MIAAGIHQQRGVALQRLRHVLRRCRHRPVALDQRSGARGLEHEIVGELVKDPLRAEVVVEGLGEDERVGDQDAAGVVADQQHRPLGRDVVQPAHLGPEVEVRHQPPRRQGALDVLGIA